MTRRNVCIICRISAFFIISVSLQGCSFAFWSVCAGTDWLESVFTPDHLVSSGRFPDGVVGLPYSGVVTITPTFQWVRYSKDDLPAGLKLVVPEKNVKSDTLLLQGVPAAPGTFEFTIEMSGNLTMCTINRNKYTFELVVSPATDTTVTP